MLLQRASISTVSAFCMQLLREHFSSLDIPPDFAVADDAAVYELRQSVLAEVLEEAYQKPDFAAFASIFGRARSDQMCIRDSRWPPHGCCSRWGTTSGFIWAPRKNWRVGWKPVSYTHLDVYKRQFPRGTKPICS